MSIEKVVCIEGCALFHMRVGEVDLCYPRGSFCISAVIQNTFEDMETNRETKRSI